MRKILCFVAAIGCVAALSAVASAQCGTLGGECLVDGSFGLATTDTTTSNSPWVLTANMPNGTEPVAVFKDAFGNSENTGVGNTGTGVWLKSFFGAQGGNTTIPKAQANVSQSVVVPTAGDYLLTFRAAHETFFTAASVGQWYVSLSSNGTGGSASIDLLSQAIPAGNIGGLASPNYGGTPFSLLLSGVTGGNILTVTGAMVDGMDALNNPQSGFLDRFSLSLVPEPTSALLGLIGMGLLGFVRRR